MKNFIKSRIGVAVISGFSVMVAAIILWPLFDMLYCKVLTHSDFTWSVDKHLIHPIMVGILFAIFEYIFQINKIRAERKSKKTKKSK